MGSRLLAALCLLLAPACSGDSGEPTPSEDVGLPGGRALDADSGGSEGEPAPGLGIDYGSVEAGIAVRWEPEGEDWLHLPWPSDHDRTASGGIDLSRFPNPDVDILESYKAFGEDVLAGFGLNGAIFFELEGDLDVSSLPDPAVTMADPLSTVQLVNVHAGSARYGERVPVVFDYAEQGDLYLPDRSLALKPVFGFPLSEGETWCALLTRGLLDAEGHHLSVDEDFSTALEGDEVLAPLGAWLLDESEDGGGSGTLLADDLASAACFTTGSPTLELRDVRLFLEEEPPAVVTGVQFVQKHLWGIEYDGTYLAANFQSGDKPYTETGGDIVFEGGDPVVQFLEPIRFKLLVSTYHAMPEEGWPVVLYGHGTGGDYATCIYTIASEMMQEGVAMICIDQPLHGARGDDYQVEILSFNFTNPKAGRSNFRQSAIDVMSLARLVGTGGMDIESGAAGWDEEVRFDASEIHIFGHSHGGLAGAMAMGVDPVIKSGVLSGAGGVFIEALLKRKEPLDFAFLVASLSDVVEEELDAFHPVLSLVQLIVDATDPINYAPYWFHPAPGGAAKHIFMTTGTADEDTPTTTTAFMAAAAGMPLIEAVVMNSPAHQLAELPVETLPLGSNVKASDGQWKTAGLKQYLDGDHFVAFDNSQARKLWRAFFKNIRIQQPPVISE